MAGQTTTDNPKPAPTKGELYPVKPLPVPVQEPKPVPTLDQELQPATVPKQQTKPKPKRGAEPKTPQRILFIASILLCALMLVGVAVYFLFTVKVPEVVGMPSDAAAARLEESSLQMAVQEEQYSDEVPDDCIISQEKAGKRHWKNSVIHVIVSKGYEPFVLENFIGEELETAKKTLEAQGLLVTEHLEESMTASIGTVIAQSPDAEATVRKTDEVCLTVSKGTAVPDVSSEQLMQENAEQLFAEAGLVMEVEKQEFSDEVHVGAIISQTIEAGTMVNGGTKVSVVLSSGKEQRVVPQLEGLTEAEADKALKQVDLVMKVSKETVLSKDGAGKVAKQSVKAGESVDKGSKITVTLTRAGVVLPKLIGKSESEARTLLGDRSIYVSVKYEEASAKNEDKVIKLDVKDGALVAVGSTVTITVGTYTEPAPELESDFDIPWYGD